MPANGRQDLIRRLKVNVQMSWKLTQFVWRHAGHAVASGFSNCRIPPTRKVLTLTDQTLRDTGILPCVRNVDKQNDIDEMAESSPRGCKRRTETVLDVIYLASNGLTNIHKFHDQPVVQSVYIYYTKHCVLIIANCYMYSSLTNKCTFINLKNTLKFTLKYT